MINISIVISVGQELTAPKVTPAMSSTPPPAPPPQPPPPAPCPLPLLHLHPLPPAPCPSTTTPAPPAPPTPPPVICPTVLQEKERQLRLSRLGPNCHYGVYRISATRSASPGLNFQSWPITASLEQSSIVVQQYNPGQYAGSPKQ